MRPARWGLAAATTLSIGLAGCMAPASPRPDVAVSAPAGWRTPPAAVAPVPRDWWRGFGDPVLDQLVADALAANPDIAIAAARVREARAQERVARSQLVPGIDFVLGASDARSVTPFGTAAESRTAQPLFQSSYELDLFGRIANQVSAARLSAEAGGAAADAARIAVAAATATGYLTLLGLDARLAIARQTVAARAEALRIARDRTGAGYTSQLELRQAEADYRSVTQLVPQIELAIGRQENALSALAGRPPGPMARGRSFAALQPLAVPDLLPSDLLRRRPDIAQAELTLAASDATLAAARAQFLPQVRLSASAGAVISSALADPIGLWSVGGSVLAPLFAGGRLRAGVEGAAARRDQAAYAYQRAVLNAFREAEDTLALSARLGEQRVQLAAQRTALAEALRHARNRYDAGYTSYLEQLDAQRSLLGTELALVQLDTDRLAASVALVQAMGGGWSGVAERP